MEKVTLDASLPVLPEEDSGKGLLSGNAKIIIGAIVLIGALGYFAFMAFQSATVYYYTVSEMIDRGATPEGKLVRVSGKLVPVSFEREDESTLASFTLTDGAETLDALHNGVFPDLFFNEHSEIILEGTYGSDGVFASQNVIVKCPSKYIALDEDAEAEQKS
ncbi:MAG: cytochrome c maturation protein CcmE [Chloroflexi bacterium]|nr:cytochrome c maturation protein CcmE [Chloroflexota bacterium]